MVREFLFERKSKEVDISVYWNLDRPRGTSTLYWHPEKKIADESRARSANNSKRLTALKPEVSLSAKYATNPWFEYLEHWIDQIPVHGHTDLRVKAEGDNEHHVYEDVHIAMGNCLYKAVYESEQGGIGIYRCGDAKWTFEGTVSEVVVDLSKRPSCVIDVDLDRTDPRERSLYEMFWHSLTSFAMNGRIDLYAKSETVDPKKRDIHHIVEGVYKSLGRALDNATKVDERIKTVSSTKGML